MLHRSLQRGLYWSPTINSINTIYTNINVCGFFKALRQLAPNSSVGTLGSRGGAAAAHEREVKALAVSKDVGLLVSASADSTLRVWNLDNDGLQWTLAGHRDEVRAWPVAFKSRD